MSGPLVFRIAARVLPAALFAIVALLNLHTAIAANGAGTRVHQILSATLRGMFAALVVVRPLPLRRGGNVFGVVAAVGAQAGVLGAGRRRGRQRLGACVAGG
jgi:hypothetical protein